MRINHNISALNTYRQMGANQTAASKNMEKLSSGLRINRAGDDAAGLAISEKMRGQIRGLDMASKNSQDAISLIQTAEGALNETHSILQRMRELAVQSVNDTNTTTDREEIQKEINQLTSEINRIGETTEFNTKKLLNGNLSSTKVTGQTTKTVVNNIAAKDMNYSVGVTWSISGTQPTIISGAGKENQIDIASTDGTVFDYTSADAGTLTIEKAGTELKVSLAGATDGTTNTLDFAAENAILKNGFYEFDNHGISFKVSEEDFKAMTDGDKVEISFADRNGAATPLPNSGAISLASDYKNGATLANNANVVTGFEVDGSKLNANAAKIDISYDGTDLKVKVTDSAGATLDESKLSALTGGETFDNYGIKFTIDAATFDATDSWDLKTIELEATTTKTDITEDASATFQIGANENQSMSLGISDMRASALGITGTGAGFSADNNVTNGTNNTDVEKALDVTNATNAAKAISVIDAATQKVSAERSKLGASQNRLEHTINNLGASSENLTAAESRIRDVDMAKEMMEMTKNNILQQAAQAMLAQANQQPQGVLQLLR